MRHGTPDEINADKVPNSRRGLKRYLQQNRFFIVTQRLTTDHFHYIILAKDPDTVHAVFCTPNGLYAIGPSKQLNAISVSNNGEMT